VSAAVMGDKIRYLAVSGFCLVLHNAIIIGATEAGLHYAGASVLSFLIVAASGFVLHGKFTFGADLELAGFARYVAGMALNLPLSIALLWLLIDVAGSPVTLAAPLATLCLLVWNYIASRWAWAPPLDRTAGRIPS